jgi:CubicO group peptidase (beta-lactamase class C family)
MEVAWTSVAKPLRCVDVAMTVGDSTGTRLFTLENGARNLREEFPAASGSKWPAAVAIMTTVRDGLMTLDTFARNILTDFWTQDPSDPRYGVQLRHLMQFTSGFKVATKVLSMSHDLFRQKCLNYFGRGSLGGDFWGCVEHIYRSSPYEGTPGAAWQYNSIHLQLAFAMAIRVTGERPTEFLRRRVYHNMNNELVMRDTYFVGGENPAVALGIKTTGNDYDAFLRNYMSYKYLPKAICDEMEREHLASSGIPKMVPGISFGDAFGMALFMYPSLYGDCFGLGGTMVVCMNRAVGMYYLILPPLTDYLKKGPVIRLAGGQEKITFYSARWWVEMQLYRTLEVVTGRALGERHNGVWPDVAEA